MAESEQPVPQSLNASDGVRGLEACVRKLLLWSALLVASGLWDAAVTNIGQHVFAVTDCTNSNIVLKITSEAAVTAIRSRDITTADTDKLPVTWTITWDKPAASDPTLNEYQASGTIKGTPCPAVGKYDVPLSIAVGATISQDLSIQLVRTVDPALDAPSSITVPVWITPLYKTRLGALPYVRLVETSNANPLNGVSAIGGEMKNNAGESSGIQLQVPDKPMDLPAGTGKNLDLSFSAIPDPGVYTSRVTLRAPGLKQPQTVDVTVKVRVPYWVLLLVILIGIGLGWWVNIGLVARSAMETVKLGAFRASEAIATRARAQKDPAVQQRLLAIAASLESNIMKAAKPEDLQTAVANAQELAGKVEAAAKSDSDACAAELKLVRDSFLPNGAPPAPWINDLLAPESGHLEEIAAAALSGDVEHTKSLLAQFEQTYPPQVSARLQSWLKPLFDGLSELGPWSAPAQDLERERLKIRADARNAFETASVPQMIQQADAVARELQSWLLFVAPQQMAAAVGAAISTSDAGGNSDLGDQLRSAIAVLNGFSPGSDPLAALKALCDTRRKVEQLIRTAAPANQAAIDAALIKGDLPAAAAAALPQRPPAGARQAPPQVQAALARPPSEPLVAPVFTIAPRLVVPPLLRVGEKNVIKVDWATSTPPPGNPKWVPTPDGAIEFSQLTEESVTVLPKKAGFISISATFGSGTIISATVFVGEIASLDDFKKVEAAALRANWVLTGVAGVLTAFVGYQIFSTSWFGTLGDFLGCFLWGFFGQFSLDRVREMAKPMVSKTLS